MQDRTKEISAIIGSIAAACWIMVSLAVTAQAGNNTSEARWVSVGAGEKWVIVEVTHLGRGLDVRRLKQEVNATFEIKLDGTGSMGTSVVIDEEAGELSAIPEGKVVHVHWRPVDNRPYAMFATKIVYLTDAAVEKRKKLDDAAKPEDSASPEASAETTTSTE